MFSCAKGQRGCSLFTLLTHQNGFSGHSLTHHLRTAQLQLVDGLDSAPAPAGWDWRRGSRQDYKGWRATQVHS